MPLMVYVVDEHPHMVCIFIFLEAWVVLSFVFVLEAKLETKCNFLLMFCPFLMSWYKGFFSSAAEN